MKGNVILLLVFLFFLNCGEEDARETIFDEEWKAWWILASNQHDSINTWTAYRKEFEVEKPSSSEILRIAVDSKYWLWLNDSLVVREGQLKRGPTPNDTYSDELDVSKYLKKGTNTLAVLMWHFGKEGFSHKNSGRAGLIAEIWNPDGLLLQTDSTWKAIPHPAFLNESEPPYPNWRLSESNIVFDAREDITNWYLSNFEDNQWPRAKAYCKGECQPWGKLIRRIVPQWKDFGLKEYVSISEGDTLTADLPYNAQITPYLKVDAPAGKRIVMFTDHYKGGSEYNMRAEYLTKDGIQEFESPGWINGHKVYYVIPEEVKVLDLKYRESGYNTEFAGSFYCDDEFYNLLWKKAARTLYVTMRDNYMDCPDRERAQWWGDEVLEGGEAFYALDRDADALMRKGMLELVNWQKLDSTFFSPVPAGNWAKELPGQMLMSIGEYGFWNYYMHTGDLETIRQVYKPVKKYLSIWKLKEDGTLVMRQGGWFWGDWGPNKDMVLLLNTQYALALSGMQKMANALGYRSDADSLQLHAENFKSAFNKAFWKENYYRSSGYQGPTDDRSQGLAVVAGLADIDKYESIYQVFQAQMHASPYMEKYILESLFIMSYPEFALKRMKQRFGKMVNHPTITTLWEGWGIGKEGYGGGTTNHAWSGGGLTLLSQKVAGVYPLEPGYKTFQVKPQLGGLTKVKAVVSSVKGDIKVDIIAENESFVMTIEVPESTKAYGYVPSLYRDVSLNGKTLNLSDKNGYYEIGLSAGSNKIEAISK
ncbi:alpha-L-rhamnosidase-related protein [Ekhidna sp.]